MLSAMERRASPRFMMSLPVQLRRESDPAEPSGTPETRPAARDEPRARGGSDDRAVTRDVSFRGLYFLADASYQAGSPIEFILTLPKEITMAGDVHIRCYAHVVRVEEHDAARGVAAHIDRYEFLPGPM